MSEVRHRIKKGKSMPTIEVDIHDKSSVIHTKAFSQIGKSDTCVSIVFVSGEGNPMGGSLSLMGVDGGGLIGSAVNFQHGAIDKNGRNGFLIEDLIESCIHRLEVFQGTKFRCSENDDAISNLRVALLMLNSRTERRIAEGVEGTYEVNSEVSCDFNGLNCLKEICNEPS